MISTPRSQVFFAPQPGEMQTLAFWELPSLVDRTFEGAWWSVDPARTDQFSQATYLEEMPFPWPEGVFANGLVEGFHLMALLDYMMNAVLHLAGEDAYGWNYGFDRVRFVSPIKTTDEIRLTGRFGDVRAKDAGYLVRQDCVVEVRGRERPGFIADWWVFWLPEVPSDV